MFWYGPGKRRKHVKIISNGCTVLYEPRQWWTSAAQLDMNIIHEICGQAIGTSAHAKIDAPV
eukprot:5803549-Karenia_brevis.AAC.1